jgi:mRNA interferase MazF
MSDPLRGEVWTCDFDPTRGHEQGMKRLALVVSTNAFNKGPADLVIVLPLTSTARGIPTHVKVSKPEGGVKNDSYILCEHVRSVSKARLTKRWGAVSPSTMAEVGMRIRILLEL